jgi:hypothetical protein
MNNVNPELKSIHQAVLDLYNRETKAIKACPTSVVSINATHFLAGQAANFADGALILMEDARQPLNVPVALLRTCLEAQARANHIIAVTGKDREDRASELIQLMHLGYDYYVVRVIQSFKDLSSDESNFLPRDRAYLPALKATLGKKDTSTLKTLKKRCDQMSRKWAYGKVVEREKFRDPKALSRSEAQRFQPSLDLTYMQCCAFVHSDPASLNHGQLLTKIGVTYHIVLAELIAILSFFLALGKAEDQDLLSLKTRLMTFDINEKVLPKGTLPSV